MSRAASCRSPIVPALLCALLAPPVTASAAIDIHGPWLIHTQLNIDLVDVTQVDDAISFVYGGINLSGTLSSTRRLQVSGQTPSTGVAIDGDVSADGQLLNLSTFTITFSGPVTSLGVGLGMHCSCVDGNFADGDGCDAECQVEPCWTCAGMPSVCTPAGDGTACEDADACTTGSTCAAGICAGGTPVVPCIDASGSWNVHAVKTSGFSDPEESDFARTIRQRGTHILVRDPYNRDYYGDIDATTGAISWTKTGGFYGFGICGDGVNAVREPFMGTVTPGGASFNTTGTEYVSPTRCPLPVAVTENGTRVGCADGTPCSTGDVCLTGETCLGGVCQGGTPVTCEACEQCQAGIGCAPAPSCPGPAGPATLAITNRANDARDRIGWRWQSTASVPPGTLGNPLASDGVTLCLFDVTTATPALLFRGVVPGGGICGARPCWRAAPNGTGFTYSDRTATNQGTRALRIMTSTQRGSRVRFRGAGTALSGRPFGLPSVPVPETLLLQLQADGGACFGADYTPAGVSTNDAARGKYRARSE